MLFNANATFSISNESTHSLGDTGFLLSAAIIPLDILCFNSLLGFLFFVKYERIYFFISDIAFQELILFSLLGL